MARRSRRQRGGESDALRNAREAYEANMDDMTKEKEYIGALYDELDNTDDAAIKSTLQTKLTDLGASPERPTSYDEQQPERPTSDDEPQVRIGGRRRRKSRRSRRPRKSRRSRRSRRRH